MMKHAACVLLLLAGCGPLVVPMPSRLSQKEQLRVDRGWNEALAPVNRLSRDTWLDLLVGKSLFEEGVDRLYFHSEKKFSGGTVVMEIHFVRSKPEDDRFTMEIRGPQGEVLRRETYSRAEVEQTAKTLFQNDAAQRSERERRWKMIEEYFPKPSPDGGAEASN